jgi:membrane-associated phospholipid phosphatase
VGLVILPDGPPHIEKDMLRDQNLDDRSNSGKRLPLWNLGFQDILKAMLIFCYFSLWFFVYDQVNRYVCDPVRTIHLPPPHQTLPSVIQPYSAIIYVFGGLTLPSVPFLYHWSWRGIRFVLCCYTLTSLLAFFCYWLWPLSMERPVYQGENIGELLMLWVFSKDMPGNCFPSSHVFFAFLGALFVSRSNAGYKTRVACWALAAAICVSTVTSGQHYFIDIPGGVAAALLGYAATCKMMPAG